MIVCHKYKFIYIKTKKTASTSLEIALSKFCNHDDMMTPLLRKDEMSRRSLTRGLGSRNAPRGTDPHTSARDAKRIVGDDIWNQYTKITSIRNTYDMMVSKFFWERGKEKDFDVWYSYFKNSATCNWELYTINDEPVMDYYIRHHCIEEDCSKLSELLSLPEDLGKIVAKVNAKGGWREAMWPDVSLQSLQKIAKDAKKEIEYFDFKIPEPYKKVLDSYNNNNKEETQQNVRIQSEDQPRC